MKNRILLAGAVFCACGALGAVEYSLENSGCVSLGDGLRLRVTAYAENWSGASPVNVGYGTPVKETGEVRWSLKSGATVYGDGRTTLLALADGRAYVRVAVKMTADFTTEGLVCALSFPEKTVKGGTFAVDRDVKGSFPDRKDRLFVYQGSPRRLTVGVPGLKRTLAFDFDGTRHLTFQDDRAWTPSFTIRIPIRGGGVLKAGETYETAFCLAGEQAKVTYREPYVVSAGPDWLPLDYRKEVVAGSAADFSHLPFRDAPAGRHGWAQVKDGHFVFEKKPDAPQRFWGANFCGAGTCPTHADADRIVARFQRAGYNTMRIHHYERSFVSGSSDRLTLNPEMMDRFDYFFAKAKAAGIYVTTDVFVSRTIHWRDIGIDQDGAVDMSLVKGLFLVHEPAFDNWKAFAKNLFHHVNPYTGFRYADDPAMPFISLVNEGVFAWRRGIFDQDATRAAWRKWLAAKRAVDPAYEPDAPADCLGHSIDDGKKQGRVALTAFMSEMEARFVVRARDYLRSLGVKALLTDWNCGPYPEASAITNALDYVDMHFYVDHPSFLGARWQLPVSMGDSRPDQAKEALPLWCGSVARNARKPFTVSEWNFTAPNACRGAAGLLTGACAARLDWDALWRFDYIGSGRDLDDGTTGLSFFSVTADPFQMASDRAGVLLFLRRELAPVAGEASRTFPVATEKGTGRFTVVSGSTAGGFGQAGDTVTAGPFVCTLGGSHAAVWASATDLRPLVSSDRILLSHLTDLKTDGIRFLDGTCKVLQNWGSRNLVVRRGTAAVLLALADAPAYEVWGLRTDGSRVARLPTAVVDGRLTFTADVADPKGKARYLYEIVRK